VIIPGNHMRILFAVCYSEHCKTHVTFVTICTSHQQTTNTHRNNDIDNKSKKSPDTARKVVAEILQ